MLRDCRTDIVACLIGELLVSDHTRTGGIEADVASIIRAHAGV
jgi:hypothetical protein